MILSLLLSCYNSAGGQQMQGHGDIMVQEHPVIPADQIPLIIERSFLDLLNPLMAKIENLGDSHEAVRMIFQNEELRGDRVAEAIDNFNSIFKEGIKGMACFSNLSIDSDFFIRPFLRELAPFEERVQALPAEMDYIKEISSNEEAIRFFIDQELLNLTSTCKRISEKAHNALGDIPVAEQQLRKILFYKIIDKNSQNYREVFGNHAVDKALNLLLREIGHLLDRPLPQGFIARNLLNPELVQNIGQYLDQKLGQNLDEDLIELGGFILTYSKFINCSLALQRRLGAVEKPVHFFSALTMASEGASFDDADIISEIFADNQLATSFLNIKRKIVSFLYDQRVIERITLADFIGRSTREANDFFSHFAKKATSHSFPISMALGASFLQKRVRGRSHANMIYNLANGDQKSKMIEFINLIYTDEELLNFNRERN